MSPPRQYEGDMLSAKTQIEPNDTNHDDENTPLFVSNNNDITAREQNLAYARRLLYVSHLMSQFSEVAWQFCLILFLAAFSNYQSLILVSTYGLISFGSVCLFGPYAGRFVDSDHNRLFIAQRFIWTENVSVLVASLFCYVLLSKQQENDDYNKQQQERQPTGGDASSWLEYRLQGVPTNDVSSILLLIGIHLLGALAQILDKGFVVAIERDWIVVMSESSSRPHVWLSDTNVTMKQIDLACKVAAPAVAGFLMALFDNGTTTGDPHNNNHGGDLTGAALLVGALNGASLVVEYVCTAKIYRLIPELGIKMVKSKQEEPIETERESSDEEAINASCTTMEQTNTTGRTKNEKMGCGFATFLPSGLRIYLRQSVSMGGLGLAMLYLNALTFGGIMTAYLVWRGMRLETIGVCRGAAAAIGLAGTFTYHFSAKYLSLESTGMWSIVFQFCCLSLSYASLFVDDYNVSLSMLIAGVCASRVGLYVFDIAITQIMQEHVPDGIRGVIGGVQQSLNAFFMLLSFALGIVFPDPKEFHIYVAAGYMSVGIATLLFAFGVFFRRDQL